MGGQLRVRSVISGGWVVLVAAVVTGAARLFGGCSNNAAPKQATGGGVAVTSASAVGYSSSTPPGPLTHAQMRQQGELVDSECHLGGTKGTSTAPEMKLAAAHGDRTVQLYVVGRQAIVCMGDAVGSFAAVGPDQQPHAPADTSITIAGVSSADNHRRRVTLEYGRAGAGVRGVKFVLSNGTLVPASVGGGWFLIWWPSGRSPTAAKLTTASGVKTVALGAEAASPSLNCPGNRGCLATSSPGVPVPNAGSGNRASVVNGRSLSVIGTLSSHAPGSPSTTNSSSGP